MQGKARPNQRKGRQAHYQVFMERKGTGNGCLPNNKQQTGNAGKESDREGGLTEPYGGKSIATCCIHRDRAHDRKQRDKRSDGESGFQE